MSINRSAKIFSRNSFQTVMKLSCYIRAVVTFVTFVSIGSLASPSCSINISNLDMSTRQPLYIRPGTSRFYHPTDRHGFIEMDFGEKMEIFCEQFERPYGQFGIITVECLTGVYVKHEGNPVNFELIMCRNALNPVAVVRTNETCFNRSLLVDIGYRADDRFLKVFTACHDPIQETNYFTNYQMTPISISSQRNSNGFSWLQMGFFPGKNVDQIMRIEDQRQTVANILGSQQAADYFIGNMSSQMFLARGHMAG